MTTCSGTIMTQTYLVFAGLTTSDRLNLHRLVACCYQNQSGRADLTAMDAWDYISRMPNLFSSSAQSTNRMTVTMLENSSVSQKPKRG